jgi:hypothetical protein
MVLTAVDVPSLLLSRSYDIHTLDISGSTSPAPHMPLFGGRQAMLDWLRGHGYTEIIAVDPMQSACLYNLPLKVRDLAGQNGPVYQAWAPYDFAWFDFLARVSGPGSSSRHVGPLIVVPL